MSKIYFFFIACILATACQLYGQESTSANLHPVCFVPNKGQVTDQFGAIRRDIDFKLAATTGLNVFVRSGKIEYQFSKAMANANRETGCLFNESATAFDMYRLDLVLDGANPNAVATCAEPCGFAEQYYIGQNSAILAAEAIRRIKYTDIYPGIDWVLYVTNNKLEYDFIVHPGADARQIKMHYGGATQLQTSPSGITAVTPMGNINEGSVRGYIAENKEAIAINYLATNNDISFSIPHYQGTLVIDPVLDWGTYFGGVEAVGQSVARADAGCMYMAGTTISPTNIATIGAYQTTHAGSKDCFLAKFDSLGALRWATYFGGTGPDEVHTITADATGNVYMCGITSSDNAIATPGAHQTAFAGGGADAFLEKFDNSGTRLWGTYYGGNGDELCKGVCLDASGNVYITGFTNSLDRIATPGAYKTNADSSAVDAYIAKFTNAGTLLWATYFGGTDDDEAEGIACDPAGNIYIAGGTGSSDSIATPGAYQLTYQSYDDDLFLTKFSSAGARLWGTYYGANGSTAVHNVACDGSGNVYVTGSTSCTDSISTPGAHQVSLVGADNAFLAKFNGSGAIQWGTYYGGGGESGNSIFADSDGEIYLAGSTTSNSGVATAGATQGTNGGGQDAFLAQFSPTGSLDWGTFYGGTGQDVAYSVACDNGHHVYITGYTTSYNGIATAGAFDTVNTQAAFSELGFLAKYKPGMPSGLENTAQIDGPSVFPNPATNVLHFRNSANQHGRVAIMNMSGQQMSVTDVSSTNTDIALNHFPAGVYEWVFVTEVQVLRGRFTIL